MENLKWRPKYIVVGGKKRQKEYIGRRQRYTFGIDKDQNQITLLFRKKKKTKARTKWTEKFKNLK